MSRKLAVVDIKEKVIWVEYPECIVKYNLDMFAAACHNDKYWADAELEQLNDAKIPEIIEGND
jgi:hypothetical protein